MGLSLKNARSKDRLIFLVVEGSFVVTESSAFVNVSKETAAGSFKVKILKVLVMHAEMADSHCL